MNTPKPQQLQQSTAGEEDPGAGLDGEDSSIKPQDAAPLPQAYENSVPGTPGNIPGAHKSNDDVGVAHSEMQIAQTDSERGSPGMTPEEMRAMKR